MYIATGGEAERRAADVAAVRPPAEMMVSEHTFMEGQHNRTVK